MNNLSVSLWAVLLKEIVQAGGGGGARGGCGGGAGNDRYTVVRIPFYSPSSPHVKR